MSETLMTEANQTNEGSTQQAVEGTETEQSVETTTTENTQQQAETVADQQDSDESSVESETSEQDTKTEGAPEKYEFNDKVADAPEVLDPNVLTAFGEVAKELDLPQEAAQKVLDKVAPVIQARQAEQVEKARVEWAEDSKSDEEFGGETFNANIEVAKTALNAFGTEPFKQLLSESGLGNHPEVIRFMYRAGKAISEDAYVGNSQGADAKSNGIPKDFNGIANALYSNQQNK